jgi:polyhydroxyalkanoate synthesis regulator protein
MFDRAMRMFSPFSFSNGANGAMSPAHAEDAGAPPPAAAPARASSQVDELRQQVEAMRAQIDALARKG